MDKKALRFIRILIIIFILGVFPISANTQPAKTQDIRSQTQELKATTQDTGKTNLKVPALRAPKKMYASCVRCHTIGKGKLIGPDLLGMNERHEMKWLINFIRVSDSMVKSGDTASERIYEDYGKLPMPNHDFTKDETKSLIDYIVAEGNKVRMNPKFLENKFNLAPRSTNWLFIIALYLILFAIFDLGFTKFIRFKLIHLVMILAGLAIIGKIVTDESIILGRSIGYEPDQPIKFSHKVHAGERKINCVYCHTGVYDSKYAAIPPASLCLNCHNVIRNGTNTGEKEIDKIHQAIESGKPIKWVKVYSLADFVVFSHAQHVNAGKQDCKVCHGDVAKMGRIQQFTDLSMGWCIKCHRETKVNFANKYYTNYKQQELLKSGKIKQVTVDDIGGNNCGKCHY